jgi:hypothetical protein
MRRSQLSQMLRSLTPKEQPRRSDFVQRRGEQWRKVIPVTARVAARPATHDQNSRNIVVLLAAA